ncbi:MAG: DUF1641 domain-containing protein [Holophagales bacterium]|nr:DUF1641 domain-containing protein [Holophagales bacterium]
MGVDVNVVSPSPQERLQARLNDPQTVESLNRLLDRLDVIAFSVDALEGFVRRAEVVVESLASGLAELRPLLDDAGSSEWVDRLPKLAHSAAQLAEIAERMDLERIAESGLLERLSAPETLDSLGVLIDKIELVAFGLQAVDGFLSRSEAMAESVTEGARDLRDSLPQVDGEQMRQATARIPDLVEAAQVLAEAGMFDPATVEVLGRLGRTIAESHIEQEPGPKQAVGLLGLLKSLRDPRIQNTLRLGLDVARRYGEQLESDSEG